MIDITVVTGATGKTGRRVAATLRDQERPLREASRSSAMRFDWAAPSDWPGVLDGASNVFLVMPQLGSPEGVRQMAEFARESVAAGVRRAVMISQPISGPRDQQAVIDTEQALKDTGLAPTILRPRWFFQNFTEDFLAASVRASDFRLPAGTGREAFVDAQDIADVAVAALTSDRHMGQEYEITGPRLLGFVDVAAELSSALERPITYTPLTTADYQLEQRRLGAPEWWTDLSADLYAHIGSGKLESLSNDVERVLGRPPRDFSDFVAAAAAAAAWDDSDGGE